MRMRLQAVMAMSWSTRSTLGLTALILMAGALTPGQAGSDTSWTPAQQLWATEDGRQDIGLAVSGNGTRAVVMSKGRAALWTGSTWGPSKPVPKGRYEMVAPQLHMSWNGKRILATWAANADEGVDHLYRSTKVGSKKWRTQVFGQGEGVSALSDDGTLGAVAWYEIWPDDGKPTEMYVATWRNGAWSATRDLTLPGLALDGRRPVVAVQEGTDDAFAAWSQAGRLRVSFFGAAWSPAISGAPGRLPMAGTMNADTGNAELVTARETGVDEWTLERVTVTQAGNVAVAGAPIDVITAGSLYGVDVQSAAGGDSALVEYVDNSVEPVQHLVSIWAEGTGSVTHEVGPVEAVAALARNGSAALITTMTDSNVAGSTPAVRVTRWDGDSWSAAKKVGRCQDSRVGSAVSPSGTSMVAGWTCGHVHAVRNPRPPAGIKGLKATVNGKRATLRWKKAKNADRYQYRLKGRNAPNGWQDANRPKAKVRIARNASYRVAVRGVNGGGPGPTATLSFR